MSYELKPNTDEAIENRERNDRKEEVVVRKRGSFMSFLDRILPRDSNSFIRHILYGIIAPRTVDAVDDILKEGIDRWLHQDTQGGDRYYDDYRYRRGDYDVPYRNYDSMYESKRNSSNYNPSQNDGHVVRPKDVAFTRRETAMKVLQGMKEKIRDDQFCSIGDFYAITKEVVERDLKKTINIPTNGWIDETYGWSNLEGVRPEVMFDGKYSLRLPKTERM